MYLSSQSDILCRSRCPRERVSKTRLLLTKLFSTVNFYLFIYLFIYLFFNKGLLADRYLLNPLAAMTGRPDLLTSAFATTKQEDFGRFSIRLFEGCGWRNVYVGGFSHLNWAIIIILFS